MKYLVIMAVLLGCSAAYAEPVSAIAAIYAMSTAGAAVAAAGAWTLASGIMFAGGALSLAGSISGNKKLSTLGAVLSLGGGLAGGANAGGAAAGKAGEEAAKKAGEEALSQSAAQGAAQAGTTETLSQTGTGLESVGQANAGADLGPAIAASADGGSLAASGQGVTLAGGAGATGGTSGSLLDQLLAGGKETGKFMRENKELVNLGGGIIKGAMEGYAADKQQKSQIDFLREQQQRYSDSVTGITPMGQFVNPNANPLANRPEQNPIRYTPRRPVGLVRAAMKQQGA